MRFYKAIKGTEVFEDYGENLIYQDAVVNMAKEERKQIEDATEEDLAEAFNQSSEFDPDIFEALLEMAEIEYDEEIDDRDEIIEKVSEKLEIELF